MATTENLHTGDASKTKFSFTFPYIQEADVKVYLFVTDAWVLKTLTTHYTLANATTIQFVSAPAAADSDEQTALGDTNNIKIKRVTDSDSLSGTFYPGSAIRSSDLNDNFTQNLYVTQEANNNVTRALTDAAAAVVTADAADAIADDAADDVKRWIKDGDGTDTAGDEDDDVFADRPLKPQGVPYAVAQAAAAVSTANTASTTASTASTNASAAVVTANAASDAVSAAVIYTPKTTKATFEATTFSEDGYFEITNSTGISDSYTSFTDGGSTSMTVTGVPATPTFDSGITVRFSYDHSATTFTWVGYWVNDAEVRYGPIASPTFTGTVTGPTINASTALQLGGVAVTSTAAELNILDGVTSTAAELNILDGVTSTAAELNILDGVTSTAAELNYSDGVTSNIQTQIDNLSTSPAFTGDVSIEDKIIHTGDTNTAIRFPSADTITAETGGSERLRIDSSGRIQVTGTRGGALQASDNDSLELFTAATGGGVDTGCGLTFYNHDSSGFEMGGTIQVAKENGTADNTSSYMTFATRANGSSAAEVVRIDSSGNVGIGKADPSTLLDVDGTVTAPTINASTALQIGGTAITSTAAELNILDGVTSTAAELNYSDGVTSNVQTQLDAKAPTASPTFTGVVSIPDKIVSTGDTDTAIKFPDADTFSVETDGSERLRVDSSGNVGIGGTPTAGILHTIGSGATQTIRFECTDDNYVQLELDSDRSTGSVLSSIDGLWDGNLVTKIQTLAGDTDNANASLTFHTKDSGDGAPAERMKITASGRVNVPEVYNTQIGATNRDLFVENTGQLGYETSTRNSKGNINPLNNVNWLYQLQPSSFNYKVRDEDGELTDTLSAELAYGLIAEDVESVAPELCFYDEVDGQQELRGIHYKKLIVPLLKALQDANTKIETLETKVAALEAA